MTKHARKLWPSLASHVASSPYELPVELLQEKVFDAVIIMDDADLDLALKGCTFAAVGTAG